MITIIDSDQHSSNQVIEKRIYVTEDKMSERDNIGEHALVRNAAGALVDLTTMVPSKGVNASNISSNGSTGSPLLPEQPYEITQELWLRGILIFLYTVIFILESIRKLTGGVRSCEKQIHANHNEYLHHKLGSQ